MFWLLNLDVTFLPIKCSQAPKAINHQQKYLIIDINDILSNMRITMPAKAPNSPAAVTEELAVLGALVRARRKALKVSATALAEAAGMSRVSVHRIEQGEPSVTMGAYLNALSALGMRLSATTGDEPEPRSTEDKAGWLPARVRLADYPALRQLAWQVQGADELSPREALDIYERNWRHLDETALLPRERNMIAALRLALAGVATPGADDV